MRIRTESHTVIREVESENIVTFDTDSEDYIIQSVDTESSDR